MMKRKSFFAIGFVLILTGMAVAQARIVTNSDLERYRQTRVQGEAEMRQNYARMGFPSPEEMARRNEEASRSSIELATRIRADRLAQESIDAQYRAAVAAAAASQRPTVVVVGNDDGGYYTQYGYGFGSGLRFGNRFRRDDFLPTQQGYFAGGQFWPTGPRTPSAPIVRRRN